MLVIKLHGFIGSHIHLIYKPFFQLYDSYNTIIDKCDELRTNTFAYQGFFLDFKRADAFCLDV